jgi:hypothetical protein
VSARRSLAVVLLLPSVAHASEAPKRLAILPSVVRGGPDAITSIEVAETIEPALALRPGLDLVTSSELLAGTEDPVISTAERCGADLGCIRDRVRPSGIDLALRTIVNYAVDPPVVSLHLVDAASASIVREAFAQGGVGANLAQLARQLFDQAGYPEGARIRVEVTPPQAELSFPGARRIGPDLFLAEPGSHRIEARLEGYAPLSQLITAESGREQRVVLALAAEPTSIVASPWLWVGVAAGAVVVAGIVTIAVVDPFRPGCICVTVEGGPDCGC